MTTLRGLPGDFKLMRLGDLSSDGTAFADGPFGSNLKTEHYRPSGARVVRLQNIGMGRFLDENKAYIALDHYETLGRHAVQPGDIVVAALGDGARPAGRACLVPQDFGPGIVKADCFRVRLPDNIVYAPYLVLVMTSPQFLKQVSDRMRGATRPRMTLEILQDTVVPLPSLMEQRSMAAMLNGQIASAYASCEGIAHGRSELRKLTVSLLRCSLSVGKTQHIQLAECLTEVNDGVGERWTAYPVLGATRSGLAPAKEAVGKHPYRYKFVEGGTIFYNPMRILLGSIALVDVEDAVGITSPDYVVFKCDPKILHYRWFYHWLRSLYGESFIKGLTRGAVRERLVFKRLAAATIEVPSIEVQRQAAEQLPLIKKAICKTDEQIELAQRLPAAYLRRAFAG